MEVALNDQINAELFSAYLYVSMAAYYRSVNLDGFAHWFRVQAQEEVFHAMKIHNYIFDRDGKVTMKALDGPKTEWSSPLEAVEEALSHERLISGRINKLVEQAGEIKDHATENFLKWFVEEQVEEEASANDIVQKLKLIGKQVGPLFMYDRHLASRPSPGGKQTAENQ
jgi:ferritin